MVKGREMISLAYKSGSIFNIQAWYLLCWENRKRSYLGLSINHVLTSLPTTEIYLNISNESANCNMNGTNVRHNI